MIPIRNIAIIAHVDHGKTTLVDALLKQSRTKMRSDSPDALIMDTNELEKERGITIFSKNASVVLNDIKINIIDTPGHADFGGEVERVLQMAEGCLLVIDAKDGPMPQTRFVLKKALEVKQKIIVVINKIDKKDARVNYVLDKTLDMFLELGADDNIADFPIIYTCAKLGKAGTENNLERMKDISPLFQAIITHIPPPVADPDKPLQMLITSLTNDTHLGTIAIGRVYNGKITKLHEVVQISKDQEINKFKVTALFTFVGLDKEPCEEVSAGDIAAVAGIKIPKIGETISDIANPAPLPVLFITEPTIHISFSVNNSPFGGREGEFKTSRQIGERLHKETITDSALGVVDNASGGWTVSGRGELHLTILIERMRREGYEFQVGRPGVIDKVINGETLTPYEQVFIETPEEFSGVVIQKLTARRGNLHNMNTENKITYLEFIISTKGIFGYRSEFIADTKGLGIINTSLFKYDKDNGFSPQREQGSLVAFESGITNLYGLLNAQSRGILFYGPGINVYKGQVVGRNARMGDLEVNVCKTKRLSNMRSKGEGVNEYFKTPKVMDLEEAIEYISDDELVEVTPKSVRIRKIS